MEHDNLRAALAWCVASEEVELGLRLGCALEGFWHVRGYQREGRDQLRLLLVQPGAAASTAACARGLGAAGGLILSQGELETARALYEESLAIWRRLADRGGIATALGRLGWMAFEEQDWTTARARGEESLALCRELGDPSGIANALSLLAEVCRGEGDWAAARALSEEVLGLARARSDRQGIMAGLEHLGSAAMELGDVATARRAFEESLAVARELGHQSGIVLALKGLGFVAYLAGRLLRGARSLRGMPAALAGVGASCGAYLYPYTPGRHAPAVGGGPGRLRPARRGARARAGGKLEQPCPRGTLSTGLQCGMPGLVGGSSGPMRREPAPAPPRRPGHEFHICSLPHRTGAGCCRAREAGPGGAPAGGDRVGSGPKPITPRRTACASRSRRPRALRWQPAEYEAAWAAGQAAPLEQIIAEALEEAPAR